MGMALKLFFLDKFEVSLRVRPIVITNNQTGDYLTLNVV